MENEQEQDFAQGDVNSFFYTNDRQIEKMDDTFVLAKISEKYPDFAQNTCENILKQVIVVILSDNDLMEDMEKIYRVDSADVIKTIYRNYEYVFTKCFITKIQKTIRNKRYARRTARKRRGVLHT